MQITPLFILGAWASFIKNTMLIPSTDSENHSPGGNLKSSVPPEPSYGQEEKLTPKALCTYYSFSKEMGDRADVA